MDMKTKEVHFMSVCIPKTRLDQDVLKLGLNLQYRLFGTIANA